MKITRIYTDESGETHFDEQEETGVEFRSNAAYSRVITRMVWSIGKPSLWATGRPWATGMWRHVGNMCICYVGRQR